MGPGLFSGGGRNSEYPQAMWEDARQTVAGARASSLQHYLLFHQHSTPTAGQQQVKQDEPDKQGTRPALHLAQLPHTPSTCSNAHFTSQLQIRSLGSPAGSALHRLEAGGCSDRRRSNGPALEIAFLKSLPPPATRTCLENNGEKEKSAGRCPSVRLIQQAKHLKTKIKSYMNINESMNVSFVKKKGMIHLKKTLMSVNRYIF